MLNKKTEILLKLYISDLFYFLSLALFSFRKKVDFKSKELLIIKIDQIGDYVLFHNFLEEVKKSELYKDYKITFLGNIINKELAETFDKDFVDRFIWVNKKESLKKPLKLFKIISLVSKKFNIVINATYSRDVLSGLLIKSSQAKIRVGFNDKNICCSKLEKRKSDKWYNKIIDIEKKTVFEFYRSREFFSKILDADLTIKKPFLDVKKISSDNKFSFLNNYVVLFPGASEDKRKWPTSNFKLIAQYLISEYNFNIVICGSNFDNFSANIINDNNKKIIDLTGKTNLIQLTEVISKANLIISNDTSGAHFGVALDIPTIILSQFNNYCRFVPYPLEISERILCITPNIFNDLSCNELIEKFKFGSNIDISLITVDQVKRAVDLILKSK